MSNSITSLRRTRRVVVSTTFTRLRSVYRPMVADLHSIGHDADIARVRWTGLLYRNVLIEGDPEVVQAIRNMARSWGDPNSTVEWIDDEAWDPFTGP